MRSTNEKWLTCRQPVRAAGLRLVCLPYAGGGASAYLPFTELLGDRVEVWGAQLPGRERRFVEPAPTEIAEVAGPLARAIADLVREPFALFGHSMGGLIAYEVTRLLERDGGPVPERLVVSAARPPHRVLPGAPHELDDAGLVDWMTRLGGAPAELLANADLLGLLLPTLRADLTLCANFFASAEHDQVRVPITALAGDGDPLASAADVAQWERWTSGWFDLRVLVGGHFYLNDDPRAVLSALLDGAALQEGVA